MGQDFLGICYSYIQTKTRTNCPYGEDFLDIVHIYYVFAFRRGTGLLGHIVNVYYVFTCRWRGRGEDRGNKYTYIYKYIYLYIYY